MATPGSQEDFESFLATGAAPSQEPKGPPAPGSAADFHAFLNAAPAKPAPGSVADFQAFLAEPAPAPKPVVAPLDQSKLAGVNDNVRFALMSAWAEATQAGLHPILTSGYRSPAKQQQLWDERFTNPFPVAKPGNSQHERGLALDVKERSGQQDQLAAIFEKHGLYRPVAGDPIHFQLRPVDALIPRPGEGPAERQYREQATQPALTGVEALLPPALVAQGVRVDPYVHLPDGTRMLVPAITPRPGQTQQQADNEAALAGANLFQNTPESKVRTLGAALINALKVVSLPNNAKNAFLNTYLAQHPERGSDLLHPLTAITDLGPALAAAGRAFDIDQPPPPPAALTRGLGLDRPDAPGFLYYPARVADYVGDAFTDPAQYLLGPLFERVIGPALKPVLAPLAARTGALVKPATTYLGQQFEGKLPVLADLVERFGYGSNAKLARAVETQFRDAAEPRMQSLGDIVQEMRDTTIARRRQNPLVQVYDEGSQVPRQLGFDEAEIRHAARNNGRSQLMDLVTRYAKSEGDDVGRQLVQIQAEDVGLWPQVQQFGERLIEHADDTLDVFRSYTPVGLARSRPNPLQLAANDAVSLAGPTMRQRFLGNYADMAFAEGSRLGVAETPISPSAFTGEIQGMLRQAHVVATAEQLAQAARNGETRFATPLAVGEKTRPGWVRIPTLDELFAQQREALLAQGLVRGGRSPGMRDTDWSRLLPAELTPLQGLQVPRAVERFFRAQVREAPTEQGMAALATARGVVETLQNGYLNTVGTSKQVLLTNPATIAANGGGNVVLMTLGALRNNVNPAKLVKAAAEAAGEMLAFVKSRGLERSPDMQALGSVFTDTQARTAGIVGKKNLRAVAGTAGKRVQLPLVGPVIAPKGAAETTAFVWDKLFNSLLNANGYLEQASKLTLFKVLEPKLGHEKAAEQVAKHLFDYEDRLALLRAADQLGLYTFNAFPAKAQELLLDTIVHRPDLILRYPRLRAQLLQETGATGQVQRQPDNRQSGYVLPLSKDRGLDVERYNPFAAVIGPQGQFTPGGIDLGLSVDRQGIHYNGDPQALGNELLFGHNPLAGLALLLGANRTTLSDQPVVAPGLSNEERAKRLAYEALKQSVPLARAFDRAGHAWVGEPTSDARLGEAQPLPDALLQAFTGLKPVRLESKEDQRQRVVDQVQARRLRAEDLRDRLYAQYTEHPETNPMLGRIQERDANVLSQQVKEAQAAMVQLLFSGKATEAQITDQAQRVHALNARLQAAVAARRLTLPPVPAP